MEANDNTIAPLIDSFTRMRALYGENLDSAMAEVAIEILSMNATYYGHERNFFEKGLLMLTDCSDEMADDVKACMFWWVFNEELMEQMVKDLVRVSKK